MTMEELLARSELSKLKPLPRLEELYPLVEDELKQIEDELKQMNLNNMESHTKDHDPQFMGNKFERYLLGFLLVVAPIVAVMLEGFGII